jgi:hypothetical protein
MNLLVASANLPLTAWQNFYVIVGSSAGALIGLQFVVMALVGKTRKQTETEAINAYGTPTVVHFSAVLAVSAIMSSPWPSPVGPSVALALCGIGGLVYAAITVRRTRRQTHYKPEFEDWLWYAIIPATLYAALALAGLLLRSSIEIALFVVAGAALGLLFIGIRNAWDTVIYIVVAGDRKDGTKSE